LDGDEVLVLVGGTLVSLRAGLSWYASLLCAGAPRRRKNWPMRWGLGALPVVLLVFLAWVLHWGAAREVRENRDYIALFVALGGAWLVAAARATAWLGISARDDAIERSNSSAAVAFAGALVGVMIVFAFANLGEGETIWTTIGPAALGTVTCLVLWGGHQALSRAADAITIDRDMASGLRFAGMVIGTGLILGRSVAGDYESAAGTFRDLWRQGWPSLPLVALAGLLHVALRPTKEHPAPSLVTRGLLPAVLYVGFGAVDLLFLGRAGEWARP
jgi:uncharacterized membrane protein YjfL (UPF0719 family)